MSDFEFQESRRLKTEDGALFIIRCSKCFRFVKPDEQITFDGNDQPFGPNADCAKCGRTEMIFEGYY